MASNKSSGKNLKSFLAVSANAKKSFKNSAGKNAAASAEFDKVINRLEDLFVTMSKGMDSDVPDSDKASMKQISLVTTTLIKQLRAKDKSITDLQTNLAALNASTTQLAASIGGDGRVSDTEALNATMLRDLHSSLTKDIAASFAKSEARAARGSELAKKSGASGSLTSLLAGGALGAIGLGAAAPDIIKMFDLDDKMDSLLEKTFLHGARKKKRKSDSQLAGAPGTGKEMLAIKQKEAKDELLAETTNDFMRKSLETNDNISDTLRNLDTDGGGGGMFGKLFEMFLGGKSKIVMALGGIATSLLGLLGLKSFLPGGGLPDLGGGGLPDGPMPDTPGNKKTPPKPKGGGRFGAAKKVLGKYAGRGMSTAGKVLPWLGRGALSVLSSPAAAVAGAAYTGYEVGGYLNDKFNLSDKLLDGVYAGQGMAGNAWDSTKNFMSSASAKAGDAAAGARNTVSGAGAAMGSAASGVSSSVAKAWESAKGFMSNGENMADIIKKAAGTVGVDYGTMMAFAKQESGFNPNAKAGTSSASGLFQFIKGTWAGMVSKYGSKYGIGMGDVFDPEKNAIMGGLLIKENSAVLKKNNIPINGTTLYAAHFLGPSGAARLFGANPNANASAMMPAAAKANPGIFLNKDKSPKTIAQVQQTLFDKVGKNVDAFAASANSQGSGASLAAATTTRTKAGDNVPFMMQPPPSSGGQQSSSGGTGGGSGGVTIDEIPMFVNDMGLVLVTSGALL